MSRFRSLVGRVLEQTQSTQKTSKNFLMSWSFSKETVDLIGLYNSSIFYDWSLLSLKRMLFDKLDKFWIIPLGNFAAKI